MSFPSGNCYIGSSKNIETRFDRQHTPALKRGRHGNVKLQRAYDKNEGKTSLSVLIICREKDLLLYEQICFTAFRPSYNCSLIAGRVEHTEEVRAKLSKAAKGRPSPRKGLPQLPHVIEAVRKAGIGRTPWNKGSKVPLTEAGILALNFRRLRGLTEKQKAAYEAKRGREKTKAEKAYHERMTGKPGNSLGNRRTAEQRSNISEAMKGRTPWNKGLIENAKTQAQLKAVAARKQRPKTAAELRDYERRKGRIPWNKARST